MKRRAQSTIEYAILIMISIAALLSMTVYVKRAIQGHGRSIADDLGEQYDPRHTTSSITTTHTGSTTTLTDQFEEGGMVVSTSTTDVAADDISRTGTENIGPMGGLWD